MRIILVGALNSKNGLLGSELEHLKVVRLGENLRGNFTGLSARQNVRL